MSAVGWGILLIFTIAVVSFLMLIVLGVVWLVNR